jgi:hypothetical protein
MRVKLNPDRNIVNRFACDWQGEWPRRRDRLTEHSVRVARSDALQCARRYRGRDEDDDDVRLTLSKTLDHPRLPIRLPTAYP